MATPVKKLRQVTPEEMEEIRKKQFADLPDEEPLEEQDLILDYALPAKNIAMAPAEMLLKKGGGMAVRNMIQRMQKEGMPGKKLPDPEPIEGGFRYPSKPPMGEGITLDYSKINPKKVLKPGPDLSYARGFPEAVPKK